ncbi:MAG: large repetitive protein [Solirubrobacteraceae bacterium]|nr:large repetitive protein [Solirubrobacteraceae bacterium]
MRRLPTAIIRRAALTALLCGAVAGATPGDARADIGFADGSFSGTSAPSGMKPQSKLWFADGIWWGVMFDNLTQRFEIYRRNAATEQWSSTGTVVDGRRNLWADAKWNGTHLFVVTHGASWTSTLDGIRIARYSYDSPSKSWSMDSGFPLLDVGTTPGHTAPTGTEAAVIDQDTAGRIWLTWTRDLKTWVTHSTTDTSTFITPFVVPVPNADNVTADDIATLVAYDGRIGVLWSNESVWCMCFAIHNDGDPDGTWTSKPMVGPATNPADKNQELADDHMNLKAPNDGSGYVYASSKTSLDGMNDPLLWFNVFDGSNWTHYTYATVADQTTRAQIALDLQHRQVYMFGSSPCCNGGVEYYKQSSLVPGRVGFPTGLGTPFISSATHAHVNNVSTTKQGVDDTMNLVAIAGDDTTKTYVHSTIDLSKADTTPPDTSILSGPTGTVNNPDAHFSFSSAEPDSSFQCSFDGSVYAACLSPKAYVSVGDGSHTFRVRAVDAAGNVDGTPATRTWTVENTATLVSIPAEADTYVNSTSSGTNYGTASTLYTDKASSADPANKQAYFRFTVTGTRKIVSAKVRTWVTDGSVGGPQIFATSTTWGEITKTWNHRTAPVGSALTGNPGPVSSGAYIDYDVSSAVTANGTYAFVTTTASTDATVVASRTNTSVNRPPLLELRVDPPPDTSIDSGPATITSSTSASFAFTSNDAGSTFACKLDAATYAPCSSPAAYSGLPNGSHALSVRATDVAGSTDPSPATYTWTVDTVAPPPPAVALTPDSDTGASSTDRITNDTSPTFTGTAEAGSVVTVSADTQSLGSAVANAAGDWTLASEDLPGGTYTISATAEDSAENNSSPSGGVLLTIDTTPPPVPSITDPGADLATSNRNVTISGTADPGLAVEVLDGTSTAAGLTADSSGAWTTGLTGLADGTHPISAVTRDVAGNPSQPARRTVTVDTVAPDTTITSGPPDPTTQTRADFQFTSSEAGATFECRLDGGAFGSCSSPASYAVDNGPHSLAVRAVDVAGNVDGTPATRSWTVNGSLPARPAITAPADGSFSASQDLTVRGTADPNVTIEVFEAGESEGTTASDAQGDWSVSVSGLVEGLHRFTAFATNGTGTNGPSSAVAVTIDTTAPATSIDSAPADPSNAATATFGFSSDESGAVYECRRDGAAFAACTSPATVSGLGDGNHTFDVRAVDRAGNTDPTPASRSWNVDTSAPDTTITSGPSGTVAGNQATFAFVSTETGGTFQCRLDGGAYAACASPHTVSNIAPGTHVLAVRATDAAGNTDATAATRTWQVQQTVFSDGFESGGFVPAWARQVGVPDGAASVVSDVVRTGTYAARLSATANTGSFSLLRYSLSLPHADVTVDEDIRIETEGPSGANVPLLRLFDATGTRQLTLYRQNANADRLYVTAGSTTTVTTGRLPLGTWGHFTVHVITGPAGAGTVAVSLNGTQIYSTTTATLGTAGVASVQLGNETKKQPFGLVADNVAVTLQ